MLSVTVRRAWKPAIILCGVMFLIGPEPVISAAADPNKAEVSENIFDFVPDREQQTLQEKSDRQLSLSPSARQDFLRTVVKRTFIKVDWQKLFTMASLKMSVSLPFLDGAKVVFAPEVFRKITHPRNQGSGGNDRYEWIGEAHVDGMNEVGDAVFIFNEGKKTVSGTIQLEGVILQILPLQGDSYQIFHIDPARFPDDDQVTPNPLFNDKLKKKNRAGSTGANADPERWGAKSRLVQSGEDSSSICTIDLLVLYTTAALEAARANGQDILDEIDAAVASANWSFVRSGVKAWLQLAVDPFELPNFEENNSLRINLDELHDPNTSPGKDVEEFRNGNQADLVSLWVAKGTDACGWSNENVPDDLIDAIALSVVKLSCAVSKFSFTHEIGHLMGAGHDRFANGARSTDTRFNHGHVSLAAKKYTLMGLGTLCRDKGVNCRRLNRWSSPTQTYLNRTDIMRGAAEGSDAADNVRVLNETACKVAKFRPLASVGG